jgi:hypothetical protein
VEIDNWFADPARRRLFLLVRALEHKPLAEAFYLARAAEATSGTQIGGRPHCWVPGCRTRVDGRCYLPESTTASSLSVGRRE